MERSMSHETYKKLEKTLWDITHRAQEIKDHQTDLLADEAIRLLQNYTNEIFMEDEKANRV